MPTGLTYKIYDGSDTSFRSFALKCAEHTIAGSFATDRGSRELPKDKVPIIKPDDYYKDSLEEKKSELEYWINLKSKPEEAKREYELEVNRRERENTEYIDKGNGVEERYMEMKRRVEEWTPDEEYAPLKELMLEQLEKSLEYDCRFGDYLPYKYPLPSVDVWIDENIEYCNEDIEYYTKKHDEECERVEAFKVYLNGLYESLDKFEEENNEITKVI